MTLNDHINKIISEHTYTLYHAGCGPSLVTQLALRVRELETDLSGVTHRRDLMADELFEQLQAADARVKALEESNLTLGESLDGLVDENITLSAKVRELEAENALWECRASDMRDKVRELEAEVRDLRVVNALWVESAASWADRRIKDENDVLHELLDKADARVRELEAENADILSDLGEQRDSNVSVAALWEAAVVEARDLRESVEKLTVQRDLGAAIAQDVVERYRELTDERDLAKSALFLLRGAVQDHHDRHYLPVDYCAARPTNAPHDQALYDAAGIYWIKPEAWDHDPSTYRLAGMRAHWERKQTDAITAGDPVRAHNELMDAARLELAELKKQMAGIVMAEPGSLPAVPVRDVPDASLEAWKL